MYTHFYDSITNAYSLAKGNNRDAYNYTQKHMRRVIGSHLKNFYVNALKQSRSGFIAAELNKQILISRVMYEHNESQNFLQLFISAIFNRKNNKNMKKIISDSIENDPKLKAMVNEYKNRLVSLFNY